MGTILTKTLTYLLTFLFPESHDERVARTASLDTLRALMHIARHAETTVLLPYRHDTVRALIWQLKYRRDSHALALLSELLREYVEHEVPQPCVILPIPLSSQRRLERGYNHVELLAENIAHGLPYVHVMTSILERPLNTEQQTHLQRRDRIHNMKGAFTVSSPELLRGIHVLILDDVITTGSTMRAARTALRNVGLTDVTCLVLAH